MKKFAWKSAGRCFLKPFFFAFEKNFFRVSVQNFGHCRLHEIIGLQLSQCLSANQNPELRCVFALVLHFLHRCYTFALVLHLNCTALSQSESSNFFMCIIILNTKGLQNNAWNTYCTPNNFLNNLQKWGR